MVIVSLYLLFSFASILTRNRELVVCLMPNNCSVFGFSSRWCGSVYNV